MAPSAESILLVSMTWRCARRFLIQMFDCLVSFIFPSLVLWTMIEIGCSFGVCACPFIMMMPSSSRWLDMTRWSGWKRWTLCLMSSNGMPLLMVMRIVPLLLMSSPMAFVLGSIWIAEPSTPSTKSAMRSWIEWLFLSFVSIVCGKKGVYLFVWLVWYVVNDGVLKESIFFK